MMAFNDALYFTDYCYPVPPAPATPVPTKPWSKMTADEKMDVSMRLLHSMCYGPKDGRGCSTTSPGPMRPDEMMLLARMYRSLDLKCADCGGPIGRDAGPHDGWQLEDGRTVCHSCCVKDTGIQIDSLIERNRR
jgi:hypothetical protein